MLYRFEILKWRAMSIRLREDSCMPPSDVTDQMKVDSDELMRTIKILGNSINIRIVRFLGLHESAFFGDIVQGTGIKSPTVSQYLVDLESIGVVKVNAPPNQRKGRSVNYSVDIKRIQEIVAQHLEYMLVPVF